MGHKRVLVVDDDKTVHTHLRGLLGRAGYQLFAAVDAVQGSILARKEPPDLVVLDVAMPGGGGPSVLQRLRNLQGLSMIPVLVYSGIGSDRVGQLMPDEGDLDMAFIEKPGTPDQLLRVVESLLGAH